MQTLQYLSKYCEYCQKHGRSLGRFGFIIKDDIKFNYNVIVDILYIEGKPVLHLIDKTTHFQARRWLKDISAKHIWDQLRAYWIDTYLGPLNIISSDVGKQFIAREFKQYVANIGIIIKNVPVEAYHSIGLVECYHDLFCQIYSIIIAKLPGIKPKLTLQIFFKAIKDSVRPNTLVSIPLVFGAYPYITDIDAPSPSINQCSMAMCKAMEEVRRSHVSCQVNDALNTRNGPSDSLIHDLPINSQVLVFREGNVD